MLRILVAEDDPDIGALLDVVFTGFDHEVTLVTDGAAAIAALGTSTYDVAVLDVMMPLADGLEVVKHIRSRDELRDLPVVLLTARASEEGHLHGYAAGADAYVTKPFRPIDLHETVLDVVRRRPEERRATREAERTRAEFLRKLEHRF